MACWPVSQSQSAQQQDVTREACEASNVKSDKQGRAGQRGKSKGWYRIGRLRVSVAGGGCWLAHALMHSMLG